MRGERCGTAVGDKQQHPGGLDLEHPQNCVPLGYFMTPLHSLNSYILMPVRRHTRRLSVRQANSSPSTSRGYGLICIALLPLSAL